MDRVPIRNIELYEAKPNYRVRSISQGISHGIFILFTDEITAILRVDNVRTVETGYKPCSQQAWDQRYTIELDRVRFF